MSLSMWPRSEKGRENFRRVARSERKARGGGESGGEGGREEGAWWASFDAALHGGSNDAGFGRNGRDLAELPRLPSWDPTGSRLGFERRPCSAQAKSFK